MRAIFIKFDGVLHPADGPEGACLPFELPSDLEAVLSAHPPVRTEPHKTRPSGCRVDVGKRKVTVRQIPTSTASVHSLNQARSCSYGTTKYTPSRTWFEPFVPSLSFIPLGKST